jgi:hypothetical protein
MFTHRNRDMKTLRIEPNTLLITNKIGMNQATCIQSFLILFSYLHHHIPIHIGNITSPKPTVCKLITFNYRRGIWL